MRADSSIGRHLLVDFYGVAPEPLDDGDWLATCLRDAAQISGMTALAAPVIHRFDGGGVTGFLVLAESHIALHTYPDRGFIALDIFCCGGGDPHRAVGLFRDRLSPRRERVTEALRGD